MPEAETIIVLLAAVAALAVLARELRVPYPILLVLGGLVLAFVPGLPRIELGPDLLFLLFLPPLVYYEALFVSLRDLRDNLRPILLLSLGLVLLTTCAVAAVGHWAVGLPWPAAFILGAIVSPTDSVSASAIAGRLGVPRRVVTVLEGEGLVNEAVVVAGFRIAVGAVAAGAFSLGEVALQISLGGAGGAAVGLALGWAQVRVLRRLGDDPVLANTVFLLFPFASYLVAYEMGLVGIVCVLVSALYVGWRAPSVVPARTRLQGRSFWEVAVFLINGLAFVLIGLQLPRVVAGLGDYPPGALILYAGLVSLTVVLARVAWVFPATYVPRWASRRLRERDPSPPWRAVCVVAWTGMRGAISLAVALSLPLATDAGAPFPGRDLILFLTFCVILATLVAQGLTLPLLIAALGLTDDGSGEREMDRGRTEAARAALRRLGELRGEGWVREDTAERARALYEYRRDRFAARLDGDEDGFEERSASYRRLLGELLLAQREELVRLRAEGEIGDEALHRVERELDLEEARLEA